MCPKIDVMERECKNLELWSDLNGAWMDILVQATSSLHPRAGRPPNLSHRWQPLQYLQHCWVWVSEMVNGMWKDCTFLPQMYIGPVHSPKYRGKAFWDCCYCKNPQKRWCKRSQCTVVGWLMRNPVGILERVYWRMAGMSYVSGVRTLHHWKMDSCSMWWVCVQQEWFQSDWRQGRLLLLSRA
jgi:hypothetical protein